MLFLSSPQLSTGVMPTDASTGAHLIPMVDMGNDRRTLLVHGHLQNDSTRYYVLPSATTRPRVAVPGETNLSTQVTTDTAVA